MVPTQEESSGTRFYLGRFKTAKEIWISVTRQL